MWRQRNPTSAKLGIAKRRCCRAKGFCHPNLAVPRIPAVLLSQGTLLHIRRDLSAEAREFSIDLPCAIERRRDMGQDIRLPDMLDELRSLQEERGLLTRTAQQ